MEHLINKADLAEYEEFSQNIEDRIINPRINDAHIYDLASVLPSKVLDTVYAATVEPVEWDAAITYVAGAVVMYNDLAYTAKASSLNVVPGTDPLYWTLNTGATLRYSLVKPFLVWCTLRRYFQRAGRNITPQGIIVPTDPQGTFQPISDKGRGEMFEEAHNKAEFHRTEITTFLRNNNLYNNSGSCGYPYSGGKRRVWGI